MKSSESNIDALLSFESPTTKRKLQSLLGVINTLAKWVPFLADLTPKLCQLVKSKIHYRWTEDHEQELKIVCQQARNLVPLRAFTLGRPTYIYVDASTEGLALVLLQQDPVTSQFYFVLAASSGLSPPQTR